MTEGADRAGDHPLFARVERQRQRSRRVRDEVVVAAHGGGGKAMRDLIHDVIARAFDNPDLALEEDQARFSLEALAGEGDRLAFTTDSYVVSPLVFPGANIGKLAVCGTINDLAVSGARPRYLSCGLILEEGLPVTVLREVLHTMGEEAARAGVRIVTGDTKVVPRGAADGMFINTAGVGVIPAGVEVRADAIRPDDVLIINGFLGDHGAAILVARGELNLETAIDSDCAALHELTAALVAGVEVHAMRDLTRGGLGSAVNELAMSSQVGVVVDVRSVPVRPEVHGFCEVLGFDPLHLANEGKVVVAVPASQADRTLEIMRSHPLGANAAVVARCRPSPPGLVVADTGFGAERVLDMLVSEQLPRIC